MKPSLQQRLDQEQTQHIDLSPLIDVVFILLIFFIVSTVFVRETGVDVDKPQAVSSQQLSQNVILLAVTANGEVFYDNSNIGLAGIRPTLSPLMRKEAKPVIIQVDKNANADMLIQVLDQAKLSGAKGVSIASEY